MSKINKIAVYNYLKFMFYRFIYWGEFEDNDWILRIKKERTDLRSMAVAYNVGIEDFV